MALTSANYQAAIVILKKRFGDSAQITAKHMEELMSIDVVTSNHNLPALRHLYDTIEVYVRGLRVSPESYGSLLTPKKLPSELRVIVSRDMA